MSHNVSSAMSKSGVVENVGVAVQISFIVVINAQDLVFALISKYFRFSDRHAGISGMCQNMV